MTYILISDLDTAEEFDDGLYGVHVRYSLEGEGMPRIELFSEGDVFKIKRHKPETADALAMTDDWVYWDSRNDKTMGYAFK